MSKRGRSSERQQIRQHVRSVLDALPFEYIGDYVAQRYGLTNGKGYLRLNLRDGFVVSGEYGWRAEEVVLEWPCEDEPLDGETDAPGSDAPSTHCVIKVPQGRKLFALDFRQRRSFTGSVPPHLRAR